MTTKETFICIRNGIKRYGESCALNNNCSYPYCGDACHEPGWVCFDCADERGAKIPKGHCYTVHVDLCGICKKEKRVTEPRDYGRSRHLLRVI